MVDIVLPDQHALCIYSDFYVEAESEVWEQLMNYSDDPVFKLTRIPVSTLKKVWEVYSQTGTVVHVRHFDFIERTMLLNTAILDVCTGICGHKPQDELLSLFDLFEATPEQQERARYVIDNTDFPAEPGGNQYLLSDYGLRDLVKYAIEVCKYTSREKKLPYLDRMLQVTHPRFHLHELFLEGGIESLDFIAESQ